jgi:DNA repair exonuclease SbcCD nuclease subunit
VVKEYHDEHKLFVGHFIMNQSSKNFGGTVDSKTLKQYRYVILGHGHNHEMSRDNWCQLGSIRYVDFGEDSNIKKVVAVCQNYDSDRPKWLWILLKTPYSLINIELSKNEVLERSKDTSSQELSISQAQSTSNLRQFKGISDLVSYLDQTDPKTKVRVIFKDYGLWREFLPLSETYKKKFSKWVEKKDFLISANREILVSKETSSLKNSLIKFLESNKVPEEIKKVLLEELK